MLTHYTGDPKEELALDTFIKLKRAVDSLSAGSRYDLCGFTASQFGVLEALLHLGELRLGKIGDKLLKSGGNITLIVDNLEKQGLVQRQRDSRDRRVAIVSLTEAGESRIREIFPQHAAAIAEEMSIFTREEQETLGRLCKILGKQQRPEEKDPDR